MQEHMKKNIENRKIGPEQVYSASLIAGMSSFGILNQAVVSSAAEQMGNDLADYCIVSQPDVVSTLKSDTENDIAALFKKSLDILQSLLQISGEIRYSDESGSMTVLIRASQCRYCPKGVGRAELTGTLCPFPSLIENFVNRLNSRTLIKVRKEKSKPLLTKEEDWCVIKYTGSV
jgi:hypothetical protein